MIYLDRGSLVSLLAYGKIVDIGCNIGNMFGDKATNVDHHSLDFLRKESGNPDLDIPNFIQAEAENLPLDTQSYDTAVLSEILEHVDDPVIVLNEAQRVAKTIVFTVPNEYQWAKDKKPFTHSSHKTNFDEKQIFDLLMETKLNLIEFYKLWYQGWSYFVVQGASKYNNEEIKLTGIRQLR